MQLRHTRSRTEPRMSLLQAIATIFVRAASRHNPSSTLSAPTNIATYLAGQRCWTPSHTRAPTPTNALSRHATTVGSESCEQRASSSEGARRVNGEGLRSKVEASRRSTWMRLRYLTASLAHTLSASHRGTHDCRSNPPPTRL
eukprot:scaffold140725_cov36-Tisochrysis_lutea.AAC.1